MPDDVMGMVFTFPLSLRRWVDSGLLEREKQIYEEHLRQGNFRRIIWFTYGLGDEKLSKELMVASRLDSRITVVGLPRWAKGKLLRFIYSLLLPYVRKKEIECIDVIKSNQMGGARVAAAIARKSRAIFELRTGYTYSLFKKKALEQSTCLTDRCKNYLRYIYYLHTEKKLYKKCDFAFVSSKGDKKYVCTKHKINATKIHVLTNYIDTDRFTLETDINKRQDRFLIVGRLNEQKNIISALRAFSKLNLGLDIYGDGELKEELAREINILTVDASLKGRISNADLPKIYNNYRYFLLPSLYEGMPKALLEAMSCGCVCFGTNVEGINEVISDNENGYIIPGISEADIYYKVKEILNKRNEKAESKISKAAVQYIKNKHSLGDTAYREYLAFSERRANN